MDVAVTPPQSGRDEPGTGPGAVRLLRPHLPGLALVVVLYAISAVAALVPLLAVVELGREFLSPEPADAGRVWLVVLVGAIGLVVQVLFAGSSALVGHLLDGRVQLALRRKLAAHLGNMPLHWLDRHRSGLMAKIVGDDVSAVHPVVAHTPQALVSAFVVPLVSVVYLLTVDWLLTLVTLAPVVAALLLLPLLMTPSRLREQEEFDAGTGRISSSVIEFVQGIAVVKTFGAAGRAHQTYQHDVDDFVGSFSRMVRGLAGPVSGMQLLLSPAFVLLTILIGGTARITHGGMPPADLLAFLLLGLGLTAPIAAMVNHNLEDAQAAWRALGRIRGLLGVPVMPEPTHPQTPVGHQVELREVRFGYDDDHEVLSGINLVLAPGSTTALVGASGSGKTTLAQLLPRFFDPTHGSITVGGVDLRDVEGRELDRLMSFVLQDVRLLRASVEQNIALAVPSASHEDVVRAARLAGIHERIDQLPDGYETMLGDGITLSGGEAQRLSLARALLADSPILILDEATAFADPLTEQAISRALATLQGTRTMLVIAHRLGSVIEADEVVMLERGAIVERGTPADLLAADGPFRAFWRSHWGTDTRATRHLQEELRCPATP